MPECPNPFAGEWESYPLVGYGGQLPVSILVEVEGSMKFYPWMPEWLNQKKPKDRARVRYQISRLSNVVLMEYWKEEASWHEVACQWLGIA